MRRFFHLRLPRAIFLLVGIVFAVLLIPVLWRDPPQQLQASAIVGNVQISFSTITSDVAGNLMFSVNVRNFASTTRSNMTLTVQTPGTLIRNLTNPACSIFFSNANCTITALAGSTNSYAFGFIPSNCQTPSSVTATLNIPNVGYASDTTNVSCDWGGSVSTGNSNPAICTACTRAQGGCNFCAANSGTMTNCAADASGNGGVQCFDSRYPPEPYVAVPCTCSPTCGNAFLEMNEMCDDGNASPYDGCSASCQFESGWSCTQPSTGPSVCTQNASSSAGCIGEGQTLQPNLFCCAGLESHYRDWNIAAPCLPLTGTSTCIRCGDGVCSSFENICSCWVDCHTVSSSSSSASSTPATPNLTLSLSAPSCFRALYIDQPYPSYTYTITNQGNAVSPALLLGIVQNPRLSYLPLSSDCHFETGIYGNRIVCGGGYLTGNNGFTLQPGASRSFVFPTYPTEPLNCGYPPDATPAINVMAHLFSFNQSWNRFEIIEEANGNTPVYCGDGCGGASSSSSFSVSSSSSSQGTQYADLSIGMEASETAPRGANWDAAVIITNNGTATNSSFTFKVYPYEPGFLASGDEPPAGCVPNAGWPGEYDCTVSGTLAPGQIRRFVFTYVAPDTPGQYLRTLRSNIMTANTVDPVPENNAAALHLTVTSASSSSVSSSSSSVSISCTACNAAACQACGSRSRLCGAWQGGGFECLTQALSGYRICPCSSSSSSPSSSSSFPSSSSSSSFAPPLPVNCPPTYSCTVAWVNNSCRVVAAPQCPGGQRVVTDGECFPRSNCDGLCWKCVQISSSSAQWQDCPAGYLCSKALINNQCVLGPIPACPPPYEQSGSCGTTGCPGECWRCGETSSSSATQAAVCGNGTAETGEVCGEPGLASCPGGQLCQNCQCVAGACSIAVGRHPVAGAVTPDGSKVYVVNQWDSTVSVLSTQTNSVIATIPMDDTGDNAPTGIYLTPDGSKAYVTHTYNTVWVIETATDTVTARIPMQPPAFRMVFSPDGAKAYFIRRDNLVSVVSTATDTISSTIDLGFQGSATAITPDGSKVYVLGQRTGNIAVISTDGDAVTAGMTVVGYPYDIAIAPDGSKAYVSNHYGDKIEVISTATDTVTSRMTVWGTPSHIAFTADGSKAYVVSTFSGRVFVISTGTDTVLKGIDIGGDPVDIGFAAGSSKAYVADWGGTRVFAISTATDTVTATLTVGRRPAGIVVTPDGWQAYVLNSDDDSVSVIDTSTDTLICGGTVISRSSSSAAAAACPNGILDAGETCEIGVCCPGGQTCDQSCRCVATGSSSSSSAIVQSSSSFGTTNSVCGNSQLEGTEQCELGIPCTNGWVCNNCACAGGGFCGDGVVDPLRSEECEQNAHCPAGEVCTLLCQCQNTQGQCGNGQLEGSEQCESGHSCAVAGQICNNCLCSAPPRCGNSVREYLEECELNEPCAGNQTCSNCICRAPGVCGNALLELNEQCENDTHCFAGQMCERSTCRCLGEAQDYCGNAVLNEGEDCEINAPCIGEGRNCDLHACRCVEQTVLLSCGDATIDPGEDCDIGIPCPEGAFCSFPGCHCSTVVAHCGNGKLEGTERCEIGSACALTGEVCDITTCQCAPPDLSGSCGNGLISVGEECEVGTPCPFGWSCDFPHCACLDQPVCGDGVLDPGELCEINAACTGDQQTCDFSLCRCTGRNYACGNAVRDPGEECDDGNASSNDGCSTVCLRETLYSIVGGSAFCGNGIVEGTEECDDGNSFSSDGCSASCYRDESALTSVESVQEHFAPAEAGTRSQDRGREIPSDFLSSTGDVRAPLTAVTIPFPQPFSLNQGGESVQGRRAVSPYGISQAPIARTGPESVALVAAGAALGWAWIRRRRRGEGRELSRAAAARAGRW